MPDKYFPQTPEIISTEIDRFAVISWRFLASVCHPAAQDTAIIMADKKRGVTRNNVNGGGRRKIFHEKA